MCSMAAPPWPFHSISPASTSPVVCSSGSSQQILLRPEQGWRLKSQLLALHGKKSSLSQPSISILLLVLDPYLQPACSWVSACPAASSFLSQPGITLPREVFIRFSPACTSFYIKKFLVKTKTSGERRGQGLGEVMLLD